MEQQIQTEKHIEKRELIVKVKRKREESKRERDGENIKNGTEITERKMQ